MWTVSSKWRYTSTDDVVEFLTYFEKNWILKNGGYEGYLLGKPSQSHAIESSHKLMKAFESINFRSPCIIFIKEKGLRMLQEWSKRRSLEFINQMGTKINNPDYIKYQYKHKSCIETVDWKQAFYWNSKRFKIIHIFDNQNMYMTCNCKEFTRENCISHLDYLKQVDKETSFDDLITNTSFFKIILFNNAEWDSSICSCFN